MLLHLVGLQTATAEHHPPTSEIPLFFQFEYMLPIPL